MPTEINFELDIDDLLAAFDRGGELGMQLAGDIVVAQAKAKVPQRTGQLHASISRLPVEGTLLGGDLSITVAAGAPYATFVEFGTGIHGPRKQRIYPKTKQAMRWRGGGGEWVFARSTAGMKAKPYLRPAVDENIDAIANSLASAIDNELDKVGK
jgi:HK97 gp10 family phage protein